MADTAENSESSTTDTKKHAKEVTVIQDEGFFCHDTGDTYNGFFEVKKKDKSIKMHGHGIYTTAEGDSYAGVWENDKLGVNGDVIISFSDGSRYEGFLKDWCYSGRGKYFYPDGSVLQGDFVDNCPVGNLTLVDPNGHTWLGKAEQGYCWYQPVNHYYDTLEQLSEVWCSVKVLLTELRPRQPIYYSKISRNCAGGIIVHKCTHRLRFHWNRL